MEDREKDTLKLYTSSSVKHLHNSQSHKHNVLPNICKLAYYFPVGTWCKYLLSLNQYHSDVLGGAESYLSVLKLKCYESLELEQNQVEKGFIVFSQTATPSNQS